jgi:hypothetical protein
MENNMMAQALIGMINLLNKEWMTEEMAKPLLPLLLDLGRLCKLAFPENTVTTPKEGLVNIHLNTTPAQIQATGRKTHFIKLIREYTGCGLGEAKDLSESGGGGGPQWNILARLPRKQAENFVEEVRDLSMDIDVTMGEEGY